MTFRELKASVNTMSESQLDQTVAVNDVCQDNTFEIDEVEIIGPDHDSLMEGRPALRRG